MFEPRNLMCFWDRRCGVSDTALQCALCALHAYRCRATLQADFFISLISDMNLVDDNAPPPQEEQPVAEPEPQRPVAVEQPAPVRQEAPGTFSLGV